MNREHYVPHNSPRDGSGREQGRRQFLQAAAGSMTGIALAAVGCDGRPNRGSVRGAGKAPAHASDTPSNARSALPGPDGSAAGGDVEGALVEARVIGIVAEHFKVDRKQIRRHTALVQDLGGDSLDLVEVVMELEEAFGIHIPDAEAERIRTVEHAIASVLRHRGA